MSTPAQHQALEQAQRPDKRSMTREFRCIEDLEAWLDRLEGRA